MKIEQAVEGFTFGCDPEMFIRDSDGKLVSAFGLIPGTKESPFKVDKGAVQVDGMAAEINTDPATSFEEFNWNIITVIRQLKEMLPKGHGICAAPTVVFSKDVFDETPDHAKALGCDPDWNAWEGRRNPAPELPNPYLRCAGGHLHLGWTEDMSISDTDHLQHCGDFVKQADWFLGAWSAKVDPDMTRRQLYGKAGAFRPKPYGVEYRVLSNFWIFKKDLRIAVWNRMNHAIREMRRNNMPKLYVKNNEAVINYINTGKDMPKGFEYPFETTEQKIKIPKMRMPRARRAA